MIKICKRTVTFLKMFKGSVLPWNVWRDCFGFLIIFQRACSGYWNLIFKKRFISNLIFYIFLEPQTWKIATRGTYGILFSKTQNISCPVCQEYNPFKVWLNLESVGERILADYLLIHKNKYNKIMSVKLVNCYKNS